MQQTKFRIAFSFARQVESGNTAVVIEQPLDVIKQADYVIDLGPEGGHKGGEVLFCGTPEELAQSPRSYTGRFLREHFMGLLENNEGVEAGY